jgi:hypothetical protein
MILVWFRDLKFVSESAAKYVTNFKSTTLGSGPINLTGMAFEMTRDARRCLKSGVVPPVKGIDAVGRRQLDRPSDRADLHGLRRRKPLKGFSLPAGLLLVSAQIRSDHSSQINGS